MRRERLRRLRLLLVTVPTLLNRVLKTVMGGRRFLFIARMMVKAPAYRKRFSRAGDDTPLRQVKQTFLLVGVLYNELFKQLGEASALAVTQSFLYQLASAVQRQAYLQAGDAPRSWERFHRVHEAQMKEGFINANEHEDIVRTDKQVILHMTRCCFFECFRDMENGSITEAFCRSDETVFNEYSPRIRFHRGEQAPNTIARGAAYCVFVYDRLPGG